eukprot:CAMPEP_0202496094 /NCGR_PEP_ID=MMETSP1361-20130828/18916_1 /ASSEMBLY_ACC=CAM_ASM_000849 /TAXON_ID=210615 /ORGANISM="Staurosira complex sp., Strain CCMP2646" /LENGTH=70 /DNA_ID=CAMNT_0049127327 /DNA_START=325 /DNA_END=537 /DNA_ORIENTATION=-
MVKASGAVKTSKPRSRKYVSVFRPQAAVSCLSSTTQAQPVKTTLKNGLEARAALTEIALLFGMEEDDMVK